MRQRLDLAEAMLRERTQLTDMRDQAGGDGRIRNRAHPDALCRRRGKPHERFLHAPDGLHGHRPGAAATRRVTAHNGDIERETYKAQLLTVPEAERLASGRQFMSPENQTWLREQAAKSHAGRISRRLRLRFRRAGPRDNFEFGINYKACGFCKFAARHGDKEILPSICGLDFEPMQRAASAWNGPRHWRAARATAISGSRGSRRMRP